MPCRKACECGRSSRRSAGCRVWLAGTTGCLVQLPCCVPSVLLKCSLAACFCRNCAILHLQWPEHLLTTALALCFSCRTCWRSCCSRRLWMRQTNVSGFGGRGRVMLGVGLLDEPMRANGFARLQGQQGAPLARSMDLMPCRQGMQHLRQQRDPPCTPPQRITCPLPRLPTHPSSPLHTWTTCRPSRAPPCTRWDIGSLALNFPAHPGSHPGDNLQTVWRSTRYKPFTC